ncbi:glycosyltransferase family 61 protein [Parasphingopyxis marina]|uniref:Glycosyltransferase family 61 protein n=1 Tax=Parasphingopyxis marina TaxID=2761622 RepID=A0A842HQM3_9SPHN|nr:glycosyltransferase family 61 protein [Parasphingopyxis marina]MBC2776038.1 glycosyltransferase family 61 protein [Parasphingopyxis marina]
MTLRTRMAQRLEREHGIAEAARILEAEINVIGVTDRDRAFSLAIALADILFAQRRFQRGFYFLSFAEKMRPQNERIAELLDGIEPDPLSGFIADNLSIDKDFTCLWPDKRVANAEYPLAMKILNGSSILGGDLIVVDDEKRVVFETMHRLMRQRFMTPKLLSAYSNGFRTYRQKRRVDNPVILTNLSQRNYCHFVLGNVAAILHAIRHVKEDVKLTVFVDPHTRFVREYVELLGRLDPRLDFVEIDKQTIYEAPEILFSSCLVKKIVTNYPEIIPEFRRIAALCNEDGDRVDRPAKLFLTRRNCRRSLADGDEVEGRLGQLGFATVDPGDFPVAEQVRMFEGAEQIVALHGAALTNLIYNVRKPSIFEIFTPNRTGNVTFKRLTYAMGGEYQTYDNLGVADARNELYKLSQPEEFYAAAERFLAGGVD